MRVWRFSGVPLLLGYFLSFVPELTDSAELMITVEEGSTIHINTSASAKLQCKVCFRPGWQQLCQSSVVLKSDTSLDFRCSQPENVFTVHIIREIERIHSINIEPKEYPAFQKFNRTFTWNLKPPATRTYHLNFSRMGLQQIRHTDSCPDKHIYMLSVENAIVGRFCQNGNIRHVVIRNAGKLSLEVSGGRLLDRKVIGVSVGHIINSLANIHVDLPEKRSTQDFFSPNYPDSFPDNADIMWSFTVPPTYYTKVDVLNYSVPTCLQPKSIPTMTYTWKGKDPLVTELNASQPSVEPGNFNLSLKNCKMFQQHPSTKGLMVHFQISAIKRIKGQCEGDLPEKETLQIRVKKNYPKSACVMKSGSVITDTVTIDSENHYELNFFDCNKDDLELTVSKTIECKEWRNCTNTPFPLHFLYEQQCIPGLVKTITWHLHGPENSAVELRPPTGGLSYTLPEQPCNSNILLDVSHGNRGVTVGGNRGVTVGRFCPKGPIQNIKIHESKIAVTFSFITINDRSQATNPIINYLFTQEISEHYIFTVAPQKDYQNLLATPAWPSAMKPSYTVSWIVSLEPQFKSKLEFRNVSQPKCKEVHTSIAVQSIHSQTMLYSTKKDEKIKDLPVSESFYLNMTNCKSPTGAFRAMMQVTLHSNTNQNLAIILSIVGILLVVIITAAMACFLLRKKKRNKAPAVSIYNPNEHAVLPGLHGIPKTLEEEDPHTYVYIDDTLVYCHLLKDDIESHESKESTSGNSGLSRSGPPLPERPIRKGLTTNDHTLIDNELYVQGQSLKTAIGNPERGTYEIRL